MTDPTFALAVARELMRGLAPLRSDLDSADDFLMLLDRHGWVVPQAGLTMADINVAFGLGPLFNDLEVLLSRTLDADEEELLLLVPEFAGKLSGLVTLIRNLTLPEQPALPFPFDQEVFWAEFPGALLDELIYTYLQFYQPAIFGVLRLLGIATELVVDPGIVPNRKKHLRRKIDWSLLGGLFKPGARFEDTYSWGTPQSDVAMLLRRLGAFLESFGLLPDLRTPAQSLLDHYFASGSTERVNVEELHIPLLTVAPLDERPYDLGLSAIPIPAAPIPAPAGAGRPVGIAIRPSIQGPVPHLDFGGVKFILRGGFTDDQSIGVDIRPTGVELNIPTGGEGEVGFSFTPHRPAILLGTRGGPRVEASELHASIRVAVTATQSELLVNFGSRKVSVVIDLGDADSFLSTIFGTAQQTLDLSGDIEWSSETGLAFSSAAGLRLTFPINKTIGVATVHSLTLAFAPADGGFAVAAGLTGNARIGPVGVVAQEVGISLVLRTCARSEPPGTFGDLDLRLGFKPPDGVGLAIEAPGVTGGGFLAFSEGEYAGVLELSIGVVGLKAIGLLTTKLPGGQPGFSLLIIITAEFLPIQLGFGFVLLGVGGLLAINRTIALDTLRAGLRTRALDSVLFPKDPVANAAQLLGTLRAVFPPAEGRYVFGPMVKLGWGPKQILDFELALILELPAPLRLVVVGRVQAILPDKKAATVQIRLDVLGILDFDRGEVSVDATLVDSRLAKFTLSGEMALRAGWKATKTFAVAVGGFHPRFAPPPGFPSLQRLAIALATGDNPRIRLAAYFAITSNTVQFGARLEIYAEEGPFSASAYGALDALVQFVPFHFELTLSIGIDIAWNRKPFLHAQLEGTLEGPTPWHAHGYIEFQVLVFKGRISVDVTVGEAVADEPSRVDLAAVLRAAFEGVDAWTAELPAANAPGVSLRALAPVEGLVVHPLGRFTVRQRALPLELTISRYGAALPAAGTPTRFALTSLGVGGAAVQAPSPVHDEFAAAQFADLPDDEKLSRPAFEPMPSGATAGVAGYRWPVNGQDEPLSVVADISYDEAVIDDPEAPATQCQPKVLLDATVAGRFATDGAAGHSATRQRAAVSGPDQRVEVVGERYLTTPYDSLPTSAAGATSYAQAAERRGAGQLVTVGETR